MAFAPSLTSASAKGTFEYIEAKIRRDADGTAFGGDFEWLCQWFLSNAPRYRGQFDRIWRWNDWPDRWGADAGIDIVARTCAGELWAIQAKANHPSRAIIKREIDSFLSESNRPQFAYRLLMATTDELGATARRTLHGQEKPVGMVLRGHFLTEDVHWPIEIGGAAPPLERRKALPHQAFAIDAVIKGFRDHDRGRLIMACGTGKTLTALWATEQMQSSLTLVLVPSLSLVQQNLAEWGRHSAEDFDSLVVCSDDSVVHRNDDATIQSTADLGVKVTTDPGEIRRFLGKRRKRSGVVFATYHSSDRIAMAQTGKTKPFDLAICDEAHRLAGHADGFFATVLDDRKIKARKRLFMTATPRYFKEHIKRRAAEQDFDLVSMDDAHVFGPEFHVLSFHEAINAKPEPLLTDYRVVVIGVTDREAKSWVEQATLVRTAEGLSTDARTLAAQIGLAKAMQKYNLRKLITFHSSVAKAARFVDATRLDSLPGVISHLSRSARPSGKLWTKHISGQTPAGQRATLLKGLGDLPEDTRGVLSNCSCLGEGVDVPVLDGVAFIDPKRSMVDIIQAVGRVIRKSTGKQRGTIVIPVFIDESEDTDEVLRQSAFDPVWQVLKALRAHDRRLADELDQLRVALGKHKNVGVRITLPDKIALDIPQLLLRDFQEAFYVRTIEQTTDKPQFTIENILAWADAHLESTGQWPNQSSGAVITSPNETWLAVNHALSRGMRGLPGGSSLAQVLAKHRGKRNLAAVPVLTNDQILLWADAHYGRTREWPKVKSGIVADAPGETWATLNASLERGLRGLAGGSSLAKLLQAHRNVVRRGHAEPLSIAQILEWADAHHAGSSTWPKEDSGIVPGSRESWANVSAALRLGTRGLPGGSSLAQLLAEHRGVRNVRALTPLTHEQVLSWADAHFKRNGKWPKKDSGPIFEASGETWSRVDNALFVGLRGLLPGSSLARLLRSKRAVRNLSELVPLTESTILAWCDEHYKRTGEYPKVGSGSVGAAPGETWANINQALRRGLRQLGGGSSLAKLLAKERGVRNHLALPKLSIEQIVDWALSHFHQTGQFPTLSSGVVTRSPSETWNLINTALSQGTRGLPGGSSLARVLSERLGVRNARRPPALTTQMIVEWADAHFRRTGQWPRKQSGPIQDAPGETWNAISLALAQGLRDLEGGSSLAKLLAEHRSGR